jgi:type VI secretion system protein ImpM
MSSIYGIFGKMPSVGDFFRTNPPQGFIQIWDTWLQRAMLHSEETFAGDWDQAYMSAPIWRFTLSEGLAGPAKLMGILMPSVDRVGRRFPLTIVAPLTWHGPAAVDHLSQDEVFTCLEETALGALSEDMTKDRFEAELSRLPGPINPKPIHVYRDGASIAIGQSGDGAVLAELAASALPGPRTGISLWSCYIEDMRRMIVCEGLPKGHEAAALFDAGAGIWSRARPS